MLKLKSKNYYIRDNTTLKAVVPCGTKTVSAIAGPFKKGTGETSKLKIKGDVKFDISTPGQIEFSYYVKSFLGGDFFEYIITYSDGSKVLQEINLKVKTKLKPSYNTEKYSEEYLVGAASSKIISFRPEDYTTLEDTEILPTEMTVSFSDYNFNIQNHSIHLFKDKRELQTIDSKTSTKVGAKTNFVKVMYAEERTVDVINEVRLTLEKNYKFKDSCFIIIRLYNHVNITTGADYKKEEWIYIRFNARNTSQEGNLSEDTTVEIFPNFDSNPTFIEGSVNYPSIPTQDTGVTPSVPDFKAGNLLSNTKAHVEEIDGIKTVRVGSRVPDGGVNLAYYHNATASFDDTISVIETNTNTIKLKYMEQWKHKLKLKEKDESIFPDMIEYNGEEDTDLEGYWGILYRDYIIWDEEVELDQEPEFVSIYKEYDGLTEAQAPVDLFYEDKAKGKKGFLKLNTSYFGATDFTTDSADNYSSNLAPRRFTCKAKYEGYIKLTKLVYNGSAKYSGIITKKDGMNNLDPEQPKELTMYPDNTGLLLDIHDNSLIDDDLFYVTDKFVDGEALYYKHKLKYKIYDSIGADSYGVYTTDNIRLVYDDTTPVSGEKLKYKICLVPTGVDNIYEGYVYTNFTPTVEAPVLVMYDCIKDSSLKNKELTALDVEVGILEQLSVVTAIDTEHYTIDTIQNITQQSQVTMKEFEIVEDDRAKISIKFYVEAEGIRSEVITIQVINKKYALYSELDSFVKDSMIASKSNNNGYMTAYDILINSISDEDKLKIKRDSVFKVKFYTEDFTTRTNRDKVLLYTDTDGSGLVYIRTFCDTGFPVDNSNNPLMNRMLDPDAIYVSRNGKIYKGYGLFCRNVNQIVISSPDGKDDLLRGWYAKIRYSYFNKVYERIDKTIRLVYSVPEFETQVFGKYGNPYVDIKKEHPRLIGKNTLKLIHSPMYVKQGENSWDPVNIKVVKKQLDGIDKILKIKAFDFKQGIITVEDTITENDVILCDYTYEEQYYHYKGYYNEGDSTKKMVHLNLNPSMYSTYIDTKNEIFDERHSYDLFNRTIHFFLRPTKIIDEETHEVEESNRFCLYHKFDVQESDGPFDLHIGRMFVRHHSSLISTEIHDTRKRGGGVLEVISDSIRRELEPDSDFYLDIGTMDGKAYQENSVIIVRADNRLLKVNGGRFSEDEVRGAIEKWASFAAYPIIDFISVVKKGDLPNNNIVVNRHIQNNIKYNTYFEIEIVEE